MGCSVREYRNALPDGFPIARFGLTPLGLAVLQLLYRLSELLSSATVSAGCVNGTADLNLGSLGVVLLLVGCAGSKRLDGGDVAAQRLNHLLLVCAHLRGILQLLLQLLHVRVVRGIDRGPRVGALLADRRAVPLVVADLLLHVLDCGHGVLEIVLGCGALLLRLFQLGTQIGIVRPRRRSGGSLRVRRQHPSQRQRDGRAGVCQDALGVLVRNVKQALAVQLHHLVANMNAARTSQCVARSRSVDRPSSNAGPLGWISCTNTLTSFSSSCVRALKGDRQRSCANHAGVELQLGADAVQTGCKRDVVQLQSVRQARERY